MRGLWLKGVGVRSCVCVVCFCGGSQMAWRMGSGGWEVSESEGGHCLCQPKLAQWSLERHLSFFFFFFFF